MVEYTAAFCVCGALVSCILNRAAGKLLIEADELLTTSAEHVRVLQEDQKAQETLNSAQYAFMNFHHRGRTTKRRTKPIYGKFMEEDFGDGEDEQERAYRNMNEKQRERRFEEDDGSGWRTRTFGQEAPKAEQHKRRAQQRRVYTELYEILHIGTKATDNEIKE